MGLSRGDRIARLALLALAVASLAAGVAGGLARLGVASAGAAAADHGALMIAGFLATVIGLERAVALDARIALAVPLASGCGALLLLLGEPSCARALFVFAALGLVAASAAIARRQPQSHTLLLAAAAVALLNGNALYAAAAPAATVIPWWFAFLVVTIAAERLEMTRLLARPRWAEWVLLAITVFILCAAAATLVEPVSAAVAYGAGLVALAAWLTIFDLARRTVRTQGFARFAATALLAGYAWLAVAGFAWISSATIEPRARDLALHALGLGFVFSMILAHAPVIVPAVARVPMGYAPFLYVPLVALHGSLALRVIGGFAQAELRRLGGVLNAVTLALFVVSIAATIFAARRRPGRPAG